MSPRPPSDNPKAQQYRLRMTDDDVKKLEYCCENTGLSKADVLRKGLEMVYQEVVDRLEVKK